MAFDAPQQEFPRNFNEPLLSTVPTSPLYERRANRIAIDDKPFYPPGAAHSNNNNNSPPSGNMDLTEKMGALELAQPPPNSAVNIPAQRQVKELVHVIEAAEFAIRNQVRFRGTPTSVLSSCLRQYHRIVGSRRKDVV